MPAARLIQPKAEGEIAFVVGATCGTRRRPGANRRRAGLRIAGFEIVDSRIRDWKIKIQDTVADNASAACSCSATALVDPRALDLTTCGMVLEKNGEIVATGAGAAALGAPGQRGGLAGQHAGPPGHPA